MSVYSSRSTSASPSATSTAAATGSRAAPYLSAAALTYAVAPYPSIEASNNVFRMITMETVADRRAPDGSQVPSSTLRSFFSSAVANVKSMYYGHAVATRQAELMEHFRPQLLANRYDTQVVIMSASCVLLSLGQPNCGTLYATNCGLYFCTDNVEDYETSGLSAREARGPEVDGRESIKEHIDFTTVASILPSVCLQQRKVRQRRPRVPRARVDPLRYRNNDRSDNTSTSSANDEDLHSSPYMRGRGGPGFQSGSSGGGGPGTSTSTAASKGGRSFLRRLGGFFSRRPREPVRPRDAGEDDSDDDDEEEEAGEEPVILPFIMGVPSAMVPPDALQVFTVDPPQIFQFLHISNVVMPEPSVMGAYYGVGRSGGRGGGERSFDDSDEDGDVNASEEAETSEEALGSVPSKVTHVLGQSEFEAVRSMPASLQTLVACTVILRLWENRMLKELRKPSLLHPKVTYASPH